MHFWGCLISGKGQIFKEQVAGVPAGWRDRKVLGKHPEQTLINTHMFSTIILWFCYPVSALTAVQTLRQYLGLKTFTGLCLWSINSGRGSRIKDEEGALCVCECVCEREGKPREVKKNTCCHHCLLRCCEDIADAIRAEPRSAEQMICCETAKHQQTTAQASVSNWYGSC